MSQIMSKEREKVLTNKIERTDAVIRWSAIAAILISQMTLAVIVLQLLNVQRQNQANIKIIREQFSSLSQDLEEVAKKAGNDGKAQRVEFIGYLTCVLSVPIEERSDTLKKECFESVDNPGGFTADDLIGNHKGDK